MEPAFRTVAPAETPVTLTEIKAHCRVLESDDDAVLTALLAAATDYLNGPQGLIGKCMVQQTWCQKLEEFSDEIRLTVGPVASVTEIKYFDADNAEQTLSASVYELARDSVGAFIRLKTDQTWPTIYDRTDAISITFVAGVAAADVPTLLKRPFSCSSLIGMKTGTGEAKFLTVSGTSSASAAKCLFEFKP